MTGDNDDARAQIDIAREVVVMRATVAIVFLPLFLACGSSDPAPVKVLGSPAELAPLTGEWSGTYESRATGRSGSITFHLTDDVNGAHGDVILVPPHDVMYRSGDSRDMQSPGPAVLAIEFVRVESGEISGKIAPYADPAHPEGTLQTDFTGRVNGSRIEGTFVTYSDHGVAPQRGAWKVRRARAS